jgi:hypothetical protein
VHTFKIVLLFAFMNSTAWSAAVESSQDICVNQKTADYVKKNNLSAITDLLSTEQYNLLQKFKGECLQVSLLQSQQTTAQAAAATAAANAAVARNAAAASSAQANGGGGSLADQGQQAVNLVGKALTDAAMKLGSTPTAATSTATNAPASGSTTSRAPTTATASSGQATDVPISDAGKKSLSKTQSASAANIANGTNSSGVQAAANSNIKEYAGLVAGEPTIYEVKDPKSGELSYHKTADEAKAYAALNDIPTSSTAVSGQTNNDTVDSAGAAVKNIAPELKNSADDVSKAAKVTGEGVQTAISKTSDGTSQSLASEFDGVISKLSPKLQESSPKMSAPYSTTMADIQKLSSKVKNYVNMTKKACTESAEKASFLCIENTSPGAQAAKGLMEAAGPVLAAITSAQKTCSSTGKVSKLVSTGLALAKGTCVGAKVMCDSSCAKAVSEVTEMNTMITTEIAQAVQTDFMSAEEDCASLPDPNREGVYANCSADNNSKRTIAMEGLKALQAVIQKEVPPTTKGTSAEVALQCQALAKDIALLAADIAGALMAKNSAEKCADQLAAAGNGAGDVSVQQYCEKKENVATDFCRCKANDLAEGCPGAIAANAAKDAELAGLNIKGAGGNSGFAGALPGSGTKNNLGSGIGGLGAARDDAGALAATSSAVDGSGASGGGGSGGGSSSAAAPGGSSDPSVVKDTAEKKKWSFGAFGSFGGGGGFFGRGSGKSSSGALGVKQLNAIKRKIASDQVSAEVSTASGKSNWEKVRNMYLIKEASFIVGQ